ncbi:response regulator [Thiohalocapsa marina]|uniref:histidine kinase n=1 Tax=Thiohalocapsa marina TaxID=424902 RepID=A0A5M8FH43_9GAMM|nr:response regulator [Thiohalocapsa marina]KAA6184193.1 response regulator [Thiohalocapsa marina]
MDTESVAAEAIRILVVEQDATTRSCLSGLLREQGYAVVACARAADLADVARSADLVLLDAAAPDDAGFEACQSLCAGTDTRRVPVLLLIADAEPRRVARCFDVGAQDYLVKPVDPALLLVRVRTQAQLAWLSRQLEEQTELLRQANHRLRGLSVEMARVEEQQRRLFARQLHDTTLQQLALSRILLQGHAPSAERDQRVLALLDESMGQLRTLLFELSPPILEQEGLCVALEWLGARLGAQWTLQVVCDCIGDIRPLPELLEQILFQGARELLVNVGKHADAASALITVRFGPDWVALSVSDDGCGFHAPMPTPSLQCEPASEQASEQEREQEQTGPQPGIGDPAALTGGGFGLRQLQSRVELLGGVFRRENQPNGGALVTLELPVRAVPLREPLQESMQEPLKEPAQECRYRAGGSCRAGGRADERSRVRNMSVRR